MTEFGTDDPSNDFIACPLDLTEYAKSLRAPQGKDLSQPLLTYVKEDPWAFLSRIKRVTVTPNPNAIPEQIRECRDGELIDMYEERRQRERGETPEVDLRAIEELGKSELIDLYQERKLRKRK
jgi:hypothetical protein